MRTWKLATSASSAPPRCPQLVVKAAVSGSFVCNLLCTLGSLRELGRSRYSRVRKRAKLARGALSYRVDCKRLLSREKPLVVKAVRPVRVGRGPESRVYAEVNRTLQRPDRSGRAAQTLADLSTCLLLEDSPFTRYCPRSSGRKIAALFRDSLIPVGGVFL